MTPKIKPYHHTNYWSDLYNIILYLDLRDSRVSLVPRVQKSARPRPTSTITTDSTPSPRGDCCRPAIIVVTLRRDMNGTYWNT